MKSTALTRGPLPSRSTSAPRRVSHGLPSALLGVMRRTGARIRALLILMRTRLALMAAPVRSERGDVPGWVMVTLMSALLVAAIYAVAGPALANLFKEAIGKVGGM